MNPDLTCAIVGDLLPPYVEGLTAPETAAAVEAHLARCPDCAARREAMELPASLPAEAEREVDYLKTVKRRGRRRTVLAALGAAAALLLALAVQTYVLGVPADPRRMSWGAELSQEEGREDVLYLSVFAEGGGAYRDWRQETLEGGVLSLTAREVRPSALLSQDSYTTVLPLTGVSEIRLCGDVIWQSGTTPWEDGVIVYPDTLAAYRVKTPYLGDAAALGRITETLGFQGLFGRYAHSLQTAQRPYGWTIDFRDPQDDQTDELMRRWLAPQLLALVGNVEWVSWTYRDRDGNPQHGRLTLEEADGMLSQATAEYAQAHDVHWAAKASVKDYALTPGGVQMLEDLSWWQMQLYYQSR